MAREIERVAAVLFAGRTLRRALAEIALLIGVAGGLGSSACLFMALEPIAGEARHG